MTKTELHIGDVVQISPEKESFFPGAFMLVTEPKSFGAQGLILVEFFRDALPKAAYFRCNFEDMEYVGKASWVPHVNA